MRRLKLAVSLMLCIVFLPLEVLAGKQPNIVMIMTDNLGYGDIGIYGGLGAPTPRIDQLARSGIQFRDFQVEPACTPSRATIMTGRTAVRSGTDAVLEPGVQGGLHPAEVTIAEMLGEAGYKTAHYGKCHLGFAHERWPQMQGFDDFWGILFTSAPGDPADHDFQGKSGGGAYSDALMEIDHDTGRILDAIADEDIREDTIVVWLSDNGPQRFTPEPYHFGDPGPWSGELGSVFEGGLRTAGMISWPGTIKPFVSDQLFHSPYL